MLVENLRQISIDKIFKVKSFNNAWNKKWKKKINKNLGKNPTADDLLNLGDNLREIFRSTSKKGRSQGTVSSSGVAWECLLTWYLNLCLANSRSVVFKWYKNIIPQSIKDALSVELSGHAFLSETDIIGFVLPDIDEINFNNKKSNENIKKFSKIAEENFSSLETCVVQCKTNWNDSSQIPFLWNILYTLGGDPRANVSIGINNRDVHALQRFSYAFATVPSQKKLDTFKPGKVQVERVRHLSGKNYWGLKSKDGVAKSVKEIIGANFKNGFGDKDIRENIKSNLELLKTDLSYFNL